jgi:2-amino-4-hydroxy-6-hydroxymethyldihydropteridine diphosphokinase
MRTGIALGSNLGERLENLKAARSAIVELTDVKPPLLQSDVYETEPVGCEPGAQKFLNAVIEVEFDGNPALLLNNLIRIEELLGRKRDHTRNVSRTIDLDILYCADLKIENERLRLPHPRLHLRRFVLQALCDIRPDLILPGQAKTVRELLAQLNDSARVIRVTNDWQ